MHGPTFIFWASLTAFSLQRGTIRCDGCGPRTYPADADREGYTYWHRDHPDPSNWPYPARRNIKMFLYLSDVAEDGGPLGVVPGSHRLKAGPWETLRASFKSSMTLDADLPQEAMPNHYKFAAPAGTALLFDTGARPGPPFCRGAWARVTIGRFRYLSLSASKNHRASTNNVGDTLNSPACRRGSARSSTGCRTPWQPETAV
jgi:hypothetical protein